MEIRELQQRLDAFARERDWERYHTPKNLAMALAGEVGELLEVFQWLTPEESANVMNHPERAEAVSHEMADVLAYLLRLADVLDLDIAQALREKMELNALKYPAPAARDGDGA